MPLKLSIGSLGTLDQLSVLLGSEEGRTMLVVLPALLPEGLLLAKHPAHVLPLVLLPCDKLDLHQLLPLYVLLVPLCRLAQKMSLLARLLRLKLLAFVI